MSEIYFIWTLRSLTCLTVSSVSPQISSPSPVWLLSASSLWPQTAQRPLEVERGRGREHDFNCCWCCLFISSLLLVFLHSFTFVHTFFLSVKHFILCSRSLITIIIKTITKLNWCQLLYSHSVQVTLYFTGS